jgi:hypothetical protein
VTVFGNLALLEPVDPARLRGWEVIAAQFGDIGAPWLCECVGCHARVVTTDRWVRAGWVQCDNWQPACRDAAEWGTKRVGDAEAELAGPQTREWTRQYGDTEIWARLEAMKARVRT